MYIAVCVRVRVRVCEGVPFHSIYWMAMCAHILAAMQVHSFNYTHLVDLVVHVHISLLLSTIKENILNYK